jgi:hypothetical protein
MRNLFDSPEAQELYLRLLNGVDDLRGDLYALQDLGHPVEDLLDKIFELEDALITQSE